MNVRQLETFIRIIEHGSFASAALALHTTQSTVSTRIKELERYVGTELFDRSHHRAQLTAKGHELFGFAKQLVDFAASLSSPRRDPKTMSGLIRLGVVGVVANTWLPRLVSALREKCPGIALRIDVSLTRVLIERLKDGRLDFAIIAGPANEANFCWEPLGFDEFVWMVGARVDTPNRVLSPKDLQRFPILSFSEDSYHYPVVERWFRDAGSMYRSPTYCNNMNVLADLTAAGLGVSLLPKHCYRKQASMGVLRELKTRPSFPKVMFSLVYPKNRTQPLAPTLTELAKKVSDLPHSRAKSPRRFGTQMAFRGS